MTASLPVCWGGRTADDRIFCVNCHGEKDNRDIDRSKCGPLAVIDRLAAYEDTGLEPEEITALIAPPNTPLTLEELREMDGDPVWVVEGEDSCYALITDVFSKALWLLRREDEREIEMLFEDYGKTWTAYRRKPEEAQYGDK